MRFLPALLFLLSFLPAAAQTAAGVTLHELSEAESLGSELYKNSGSTGLVLVVVRGNQVYFPRLWRSGAGIARGADEGNGGPALLADEDLHDGSADEARR